MGLYTETYAVVSYEEMMASKQNLRVVEENFRTTYKNFLVTCLCEMGFWNKRVRFKKTGVEGLLLINERTYYKPYEIKFYPFIKNGNISKSPRYFLYCSDESIIKDLTEAFELVGDENAS